MNTHNNNLLILLFTLFISLFATQLKAITAVYTVTSDTTADVSGVTPAGSSAVFKNTSGLMQQITYAANATLILSKYEGMSISKVILSMHSGKASGAGSLNIYIGDSNVYTHHPTSDFNTSFWYGDWSADFVPIEKALDNVPVEEGETIKIKIDVSSNSLYIESYTIVYENAAATTLSTPTNITTSNTTSSTTSISWDAVANAGSYEVHLTDKDTYNQTFTANTNSLHISDLTQGTTYTYTVQAISSTTLYSNSEKKEATFSTIIGAQYTVTFDAGAGASSLPSETETAYGSGILLPNATLQEPLHLAYTFVGWSLSPLSAELDYPPEILLPSTTYFPISNITLYAVYRSLQTFGHQKVEETTSFESPNSKWTVDHSEKYSADSWAIYRGNSIVSPPFPMYTEIEKILVNMRSSIKDQDITLTVKSGEKQIAYQAMPETTFKDYVLVPNQTISSPLSFSAIGYKVTYSMGVKIKSVTIYALMPKLRYEHKPRIALPTPIITAEEGDGEITLYWSAVEDAASYTLQIDDKEVTTIAQDEPCRYVFTGLEPSKKYSITVHANSADAAMHSSYAQLYATTHTNGVPSLIISDIDIYAGTIDITHSMGEVATMTLLIDGEKYTNKFTKQAENSWRGKVVDMQDSVGKTISVRVVNGTQYAVKSAIIPSSLVAKDNATKEKPTSVNVSTLASSAVELSPKVNLIINEDRELESLTLDTAAQLTVPEGRTLKVNRLQLQSNNNTVPELNIAGALYSHLGIKFIKTIDDSKYYFISLPFDCPLFYVTGYESNVGAYETDWVVAHYDEEMRATQYEDVIAGKVDPWVDLKITDTLQANKGYIIATFKDNPVTFMFPQTLKTTLPIENKPDVNVSATQNTKEQLHVGWNLISLPSYASSQNKTISYTSTSDMPISYPDENGLDYVQGYSSEMDIDPFSSFFVQVPSDGKVIFSQSSNQQVQSKTQDTLLEKLTLSLTHNSIEQDATSITFYPDAPLHYWITRDLEKLSSFSLNPQIYTLDHSVRLVFNARAHCPKDTIAVGIYLPHAGEYTISLPSNYSAKVLDAQLQQSSSSLSFTVETSGFIDDRFKVIIDRSPTSNGNVEDSNITVYYEEGNVVVNNLEQSTSVALYAACGKLIRTYDLSSSLLQLEGLPSGVYLLKVGQETVKIVVK